MPKMLSKDEVQYLIWVTSEAYEGFGAVVDLGPWLGASSAALAEGLRRRGSDAKVHAFDLFAWHSDYMEQYVHEGLRHGDDFMPVFLRETSAHAQWIEARRMNLLEGSWDGGPIEILFVDAAKSWELLDAILRVFGPHLVPGRSRVVHQDFRHPWSHWLPLVCDSAPEVWREVEAVQVGDTVTFRLEQALAETSPWPPSFGEDSFSAEVSKRVFAARIAASEGANRKNYRLGLLRKLIWEGDRAAAAALRGELVRGNEEMPAAQRSVDIEAEVAAFEARARDELVVEALAELRNGRQDRALDYAARLDGLAQGELVRGVITRWNGDTARAEAHQTRAIELDGAMYRARFERAEMRIARGAFAEAQPDIVAGLAAIPPAWDGWVRYASEVLESLFRAQGDHEAALRTLAGLEPRWREHAHFQVLRGVVLSRAGQRALAQAALNEALRLQPRNERAQELLAEMKRGG
jgi:tetratricopeptide (TPR) repeat protein